MKISDWLEDDGYTAEAEVLESKLDELTKIMKPVQHRYKEHTERPDAMKVLDQTLNSTSFFLTSMKNFTEQLNASAGDDPKYTLYTTVEISTFEKLINDTLVNDFRVFHRIFISTSSYKIFFIRLLVNVT